MIDFELSPEILEIQRTARRFAEKEIKPIAAEVDKDPDPEHNFPYEVVKKGCDIGFHIASIPEPLGGGGGGLIASGIVFEELARGDAGIAGILGITGLGLTPILLGGSPEQQEKFIRPFCEADGVRIACLVVTEPGGGSDSFDKVIKPPHGTKTTAKREGNEYVINGTKCFITCGNVGDLYTVLARTDKLQGQDGGTSWFVLPQGKETPGVSIGKIEDKMGQRSCPTTEVIFDNVRIPEDNLLGDEGDGFLITKNFLAASDPAVGLLAIGIAQAAFEEALEYAKTRVQGGKSIIEHQLVGARLIDMEIAIESARLLCWKALWYGDNNVPGDSKLSMMAKIYATDVCMKVTTDVVQIFGGYGYMKDYPVEKYMRDAKVTQIYEGANDVLRITAAREYFE